ncbi:MAG: hypothetical protein H6708_24000 [Kofleriaceae bacterium]|nr:hypothetical protein [Kofleriaceae bacterium]
MALSARRRQLLESERWRALGAFVERWYLRPLSDGDGNTAHELAHAVARLARPLPGALAEWYELIGRRLRPGQDTPRLLAELSVEAGRIRVWTENQGCWRILTRVDDSDDPRCFVDDASYASPDAPLSRTLLGMLVSDTLVGAWAGGAVGAHAGSIGDLSPAVRGGYCDHVEEAQADRLRSAYPPLDLVCNPYFDEPCRGDGTTLVRISAVAIEWMTATDDAFTALDDVVGLAPAGGEHVVVAAFDGLSAPQARHLTVAHPGTRRLPTVDTIQSLIDTFQRPIDTFQRLIGDTGHVQGARGGSDPRFEIRTRAPQRVLARILEALPPDLLPHLTVAARPVAISVFEFLEGRTAFPVP